MPSVEDLWATRQLDASRIPLSMRNDSALASRWFWSLCDGKPDDSGTESNGETQTARISFTAHLFWSPESSMSTKQRVNGPKRRGQGVKAQSAAGLAEVARH